MSTKSTNDVEKTLGWDDVTLVRGSVLFLSD